MGDVNIEERIAVIESKNNYDNKSLPIDQLGSLTLLNQFLPVSSYYNPSIFAFYRFLRDTMPDISSGIWGWVCLCATGMTTELITQTPLTALEPPNDKNKQPTRAEGDEPQPKENPKAKAASALLAQQQQQAMQIIKALDMRIFPFDHSKNQGMDGIAEMFFREVFTYGAFACELVVDRRRTGIVKVNTIDPSTIRFKRKPGSYDLIPYQTLPGTSTGGLLNQDPNSMIELNPNTFFYYGLGVEGDSPYGTSILSAIPFVARIQNKMVSDMQASMHNAGYPRYQVRYTPPKQNTGESPTDYKNRINANFTSLTTQLKDIPPDANFVTYDNVEITVLDAAGKVSIEWYNNHKAVTEQIISGMKLAPFMVGKNYGTTETWGAAQYDLMVRNAGMVQRGCKRMIEWIHNLELMLKGSPIRAELHFDTQTTPGMQAAAQSRSMEITAIMSLVDEGIIDQSTAARELGYMKAALPGPDYERMRKKAEAQGITKEKVAEIKAETDKETTGV